MKRRLVVAAQLGLLASATWLFIATSPANECTPTGSVTFAVQSTCGPSGAVSATNDSYCVLTLDGGPEVNLPPSGWIATGTTVRSGEWSMGAQRRSPATNLDAGVDAGGGLPDGGIAPAYEDCRATPQADGTLALDCFAQDAGTVCSGTLTPLP